jgi:hypothetical protein
MTLLVQRVIFTRRRGEHQRRRELIGPGGPPLLR